MSLVGHIVLVNAPSVGQVLTAWSADPLVLVPIVAAGWLYLVGVRRTVRRFPAAPRPARRTFAFMGGLVVIVLALQSPIDAFAGTLLWVHMVQHLLLVSVAAPLLVLGAPVTLALRAGSPAVRGAVLRVARSRPAEVLSHPAVAWVLFAGVMVGTHFSPLYEAALEHGWIHDLEHVLYLVAGVLFWWPIAGLDPSRHRLSHPLRMLYLFLAGPVNTFTALAVYSSHRVLYRHYAQVGRAWGPTPLADQRIAGALMWLVGDVALLVSIVLVAAVWASHDRRLQARADERLDARA